MEGEALVWKPANQQSLWDSTRLPDQLDSRRDLEEPFQNTSKALPPPQQPAAPPAPPAETEPSTDDSLPIAVLKAAAGEAASSSASEMSSEKPAAGAMQQTVNSAEGKGSDAVSIPYDWAVSIGPDGAAEVDGGAGSLTVVPRAAEEAGPRPKSAQAPRTSSSGQPHGKDASSTSDSSGSNGASHACSHAKLCALNNDRCVPHACGASTRQEERQQPDMGYCCRWKCVRSGSVRRLQVSFVVAQ